MKISRRLPSLRQVMLAIFAPALIAGFIAQTLLFSTTNAEYQGSWTDSDNVQVTTEPVERSEIEAACREAVKGQVRDMSGKTEVEMCVSRGLNISLASYSSHGSSQILWALKPDGSDTYLPLVAWREIQSAKIAEGTDKIVVATSSAAHGGMYEVYVSSDDPYAAQLITSGSHAYFRLNIEAMKPVTSLGGDETMQFTRPVLSQNGRFVIDSSGGSYATRVNLETREFMRFGSGYDMHVTAISNDGRYVFFWSSDRVPNAGVADLYGCLHGGSSSDSIERIRYKCLGNMYTVNRDKVADMFVSEGHFLSSDESSYRYYVSLPSDHPLSSKGMLQISLRLSNDQVRGGRQLDYLALGDSISSGEGDTEHRESGGKYYRYQTDENGDKKKGIPREKCHVSERSYPYRLAPAMSLGEINLAPETVRWASVACSGATTGDIVLRNSDIYEGQKNGDTARLQGFDVGKLKSEALAGFIPGRHKQMEFVKRHHPRAVTITVGANDIEFSGKLAKCVLQPVTCPSATKDGRKELAKEIQGMYDDLRSTYREIYERSGRSAKVFAIGYPRLIKDGKDVSNCPTSTKWINEEERLMINKATIYLNQVIRAAASSAGVYYLEGAQDALIGHRLCEGEDSYVTPATAKVVGSDEIQETFHPNAKGHEAMSKAFRKRMSNKSFADFDVCPHTPDIHDINCPNPSAKAPIPERGYFGDISSTKKTQTRKMTAQSVVKQVLIQLVLPLGSFMPHTIAGGSVRSEPVEIGTFTTDANGGLDIDVSIPGTVPAGFHTLTVDGVGLDGEPIRYVQVIEVMGSDPNDRDEDGIPDHSESCLYVELSYIDEDGDGVDDICDFDVSRQPATDGASPVYIQPVGSMQDARTTNRLLPTNDAVDTSPFFSSNSAEQIDVFAANSQSSPSAPFIDRNLSGGLPKEGQPGQDSVPYGSIASILVGSIITILVWGLYAKRKSKR